ASDARRGGARGIRGDPAQGGRARPLASLDDRGRNVRGGALDGLDVPLLELQGVRLRPAASALDAARHGAERDDRGHAPRGLPLPHLRGVRGVGPDQAVHRRADACGAPRGPSRQGPSVSQGGHMDRIIIFDTSLRDGEQSPGFSMNTLEKLEMARQLARLQVDVIEAGFPISSDEDFGATREVAKQVGTLENAPTICGLSRVGLADIDRCWEAVKYARKPRIHTFVATSDIHLKYKLRKSRAEVLKAAVDAVRHAKGYCEDVEFSPEDASRSDFDYMCDVLSAAIEAGAKTINIPDTVGYAIPREWGELKEKLTYEIMRPEDIGRPSNKLVLGKHSGRHALAARLKDLGVDLSGPDLDRAFKAFKDLADRKKEVYDEDLMAIVTDEAAQGAAGYELEYLHVISGTGVVPSATVKLKKDGQVFQDSGVGDGPVDAVLNAIDAVTG